ncbi:MAG: SpaA isopeptide-forming pilin-related protein [Bacilli bacterium]|nr:SpaA isopeptide-forming pilin-related protein [Bacilli bacterium]
MKKKIFLLIAGILCLFGFTVKAEASAPSTIKAGNLTPITNYINGVQASLKTTSNGQYLYCEIVNLLFPRNKTLTLGTEVDKGFAYILNNKPKTGDSNKNYYIMQMAVWWYKDILNGGNNNVSANTKTYCTKNRSTHDVCGKIYNLVEGAKKYQVVKGKMSFDDAAIKFTKSGEYYVSDKISFSSTNLTSLGSLKLVKAPTGSSIIESTINSTNKAGTFKIKVPTNSVKEGETINFSVEINANYNTYSVYDYFYGSAYQRVIYDVVYAKSHPLSASKTFSITKEITPKDTNLLTIYKVDQDGNSLKNATLTLYKGNCLNTTCLNSNSYASWKTTTSPKIFIDIPTGYYTIEETNTPTGYTTATKGLIYIKNPNESYNYTVVNVKKSEVKPVKISKTDITGENEIAGATLIIRDSNNKEVASWVSTTSPKYLTLAKGEYTLIEKYAPIDYKLTTNIVEFKVDELGNVMVRNEEGKYVLVEYISIINETNDTINVSKLDKSTNDYLAGAKLVIKNEKGDIVTTWVTTGESYNVALTAGDYTLEETSVPAGYDSNNEVIYFRVLENGTLMIKNSSGEYELANGIIIYNVPVLEEETVIVPKTGLTSILTYTFGTLTLASGAYLLMKNGQFSI